MSTVTNTFPWIDQLHEIDLTLSNEAAKLRQLADKLIFEYIMEFELNDDVPPIPHAVTRKQGVCLFEIQNNNLFHDKESWAAAFEELWKNTDVIWVPGMKKSRIHAHSQFNE